MKTKAFFSSAFTLIELLVVMGIIVLMGALVVPAVSGSLKGTALNQASQTVLAQINNAQQLALAKGQTMELRIVTTVDPDSANSSSDTSTSKVRAMQLYSVQNNPAAAAGSSNLLSFTPITKLDFLPNSIIIDSGAGSKLSTLCDLGNTFYVPKGSDISVLPKLPRIGTNYGYFRIRFRADGSTDLNPNQSWFLTIHNLTSGDNLQSPPSNFFTVEIDPVQGSTRTFRPM